MDGRSVAGTVGRRHDRHKRLAYRLAPLLPGGGRGPRGEAFAKWLVETGTVVFSATLGAAPWERTAIVDRPAAEAIADLTTTEGSDILVFSSASASRRR